ncbi:hypothetical protein BD769DRAFT_1351372, partial [Suillus cothurnatus]
WLKSKEAKLVCICSSQLMSSLENMRPCFLSQKMDVEGPEKKMPSTAVKVTKRSLKVEC